MAKVVQNKTIDNEVHKSVAMHQEFKKKIAAVRKRNAMEKITDENQRLLQRIQEVPPAYNHLVWEEEAKERDVIMRTMALYPDYYERLDKKKLGKQKSSADGYSLASTSPTRSVTKFPKI